MKNILGLIFISTSMFSMQLDIVKASAVQSKLHRHNTHIKLSDMPKANPVFIMPAHKIDPVKTESLSKIHMSPKTVFVPERLGSLELYQGDHGFSILKDGKKHDVQKCFVDSMIRNANKEQLQTFLKAGYIAVNQSNDGTFMLKAHNRVEGGGALGASIGAFIGKAAVYIVGHGAIQIVGICTGPAYPVTVLALESWLAIPIEGASMAGAVAGGMILGVATGPV